MPALPAPRPTPAACTSRDRGAPGGSVAESGQTLQGSLSAGWLAGKPDYPPKLKVPEGYEKINEKSNRSRLYRSQILQVNTHVKALAEIYTMHPFTPFSWDPSG